MAEPIKVNAYYSICEFAVGENVWHVLTDEKLVVVARHDCLVCMNEREQLYSLLYSKDATTHTFKTKDTEMVIMSEFGVSLYEGIMNVSNKKNVTKI